MNEFPPVEPTRAGARAWTAEEGRRALKLSNEGQSMKQIGAIIGRSSDSVRSYVNYARMSPEKRRLHNIKKHTRSTPRIMKSGVMEHRVIKFGAANEVPAEVWEDRNRRLMAERSITAVMFGDPEPGRRRL